MKKEIKTKYLMSAIGALAIIAVGMAVNLIACYCFHITPPLTTPIPGGECISHVGFGLDFLEIFALSDKTQTMSTYYHTYFDIKSFAITFLIAFALILQIIRIIQKCQRL